MIIVDESYSGTRIILSANRTWNFEIEPHRWSTCQF